jgi:hypothetical protein
LFAPAATAVVVLVVAGASSSLAALQDRQQAHLQTLSNWLAADVRAAIARNAEEVEPAVFSDPSVASALVFSGDGYVLGPKAHVGRILQTLPERSEPIGQLTMSQAIPGDGFIDLFTVVQPPQGHRVIGWLRVRSSPPPPLAAPLAAGVLAALAGAALAAILIHRSVSRALRRFTRDIDTALLGHADGTSDPMGIAAFDGLAETVNYLLARHGN